MALLPPAGLGGPTGTERCSPDCQTCRHLRAALLGSLDHHALSDLTEAAVAERAGVSEGAFRDHFGSVADCFLAAYEKISDEVLVRFALALEWPDDWHDRMEAAFVSIVDTYASVTGGRSVYIEACMSGDHRVRRHRASVRAWLAGRLHESHDSDALIEKPDGYFEVLCGAVSLTIQEEFIAGAAVHHVRDRVREAASVFEPAPA
jgi:AcrR family transcriptional regulator